MGIAHSSVPLENEPETTGKKAHKPLITSVKTLGDWIRANRIAKMFAPHNLGAKMGITHSIIRSWEDGTSRPTGQQIRDLTRIFGQAPPSDTP